MNNSNTYGIVLNYIEALLSDSLHSKTKPQGLFERCKALDMGNVNTYSHGVIKMYSRLEIQKAILVPLSFFRRCLWLIWDYYFGTRLAKITLRIFLIAINTYWYQLCAKHHTFHYRTVIDG